MELASVGVEYSDGIINCPTIGKCGIDSYLITSKIKMRLYQ